MAAIKQKLDKPPKDLWDKLSSVSSLVSGFVVAVLGAYATHLYNRRQKLAEERRKEQELLIAQIQTVEKFFPHLTSEDEGRKSGALVAIAALGNEELAIKLARAFSGPGATSALTTIASTAGAAAAAEAEEVLLDALSYLKPRIVAIYGRFARIATGFAVEDGEHVVTTAHSLAGASGDLRVQLTNAAIVPAELISVDEVLDLALLRTDPLEHALVGLPLSTATPAAGDRVTALFISTDGSLRARVGTVVDAGIPVAKPGPPEQRIGVRLPVDSYASGTPVLDREGRLIGVVQSSVGLSTILISAADVRTIVEKSRA